VELEGRVEVHRGALWYRYDDAEAGGPEDALHPGNELDGPRRRLDDEDLAHVVREEARGPGLVVGDGAELDGTLVEPVVVEDPDLEEPEEQGLQPLAHQLAPLAWA
jgi:hypothetical protein